jgi:hypothetical protein
VAAKLASRTASRDLPVGVSVELDAVDAEGHPVRGTWLVIGRSRCLSGCACLGAGCLTIERHGGRLRVAPQGVQVIEEAARAA